MDYEYDSDEEENDENKLSESTGEPLAKRAAAETAPLESQPDTHEQTPLANTESKSGENMIVDTNEVENMSPANGETHDQADNEASAAHHDTNDSTEAAQADAQCVSSTKEEMQDDPNLNHKENEKGNYYLLKLVELNYWDLIYQFLVKKIPMKHPL